eukprot:TRINITY_DN9716_c0_g1_i1.p1 TRINITY_DN9716_c0_g1~~TRINITY_DN9716_c0_g1_i1.p1  ORF type:complete len:123 (-),score=22.76 TRINITY_DN9716_c0_g1_i1:255-623(-)
MCIRDRAKRYATRTLNGKYSEPDYQYYFHHSYEKVNERMLNFLINQNLSIRLMGYYDSSLPRLERQRTRRLSEMKIVPKKIVEEVNDEGASDSDEETSRSPRGKSNSGPYKTPERADRSLNA